MSLSSFIDEDRIPIVLALVSSGLGVIAALIGLKGKKKR